VTPGPVSCFSPSRVRDALVATGIRKIHSILLTLVLVGCAARSAAEDRRVLLDLKGSWRFEIGDDMNRARQDFDDRNWATVKVPSPWEDEGFPGYDGFGWYRKHFLAKPEWIKKDLSLRLGVIDDVEEVYVNGHFIGFSGSFPPKYITAYNVFRQYHLPAEFLNPSGDNVIAVRVFDDELSGGITGGEVAIVELADVLTPDLPLKEGWRFKTGDGAQFRAAGFDDASWGNIRVPAYWETEGYRGYDGFAWYRLRFSVPPWLMKERLILMLGKIDDFDEAFLNGERIGETGPSAGFGNFGYLTNDYLTLRAYTIPPGLLLSSGDNVIAVRVFDGFLHGGIYEGPVGLVTRDRYLQWEKRQRGGGNWIHRLRDFLFP